LGGIGVPDRGVVALPADEVHLWSRDLDRATACAATLDDEELDRARRLRRPVDRRRFVAAHTGLREILGAYLWIAPETIMLARDPGGRPCVTGGSLRFSMARCDGLALYAITRTAAVGIDVERLRRVDDCNRVATHFFTPREAMRLRKLDEPARSVTFLTCWTRKEAVLKCTGDGIVDGLDRFDAELGPPTEWTVLDVPLDRSGYLAAAAVLGRAEPRWQGRACGRQPR